MQDHYIKVNLGCSVIVGPDDGQIGMSVFYRGGHVNVYMTPEQTKELIEALTKSLETV